MAHCRDCWNARKRVVNKKSYVKGLTTTEWHKYYHINRTYGLTKDQYEFKLMMQLQGCAICKLPFNENTRVAVDHDHQTNIVRDLLCYKCNGILGLLNDDESYVLRILDYLKKYSEENVA